MAVDVNEQLNAGSGIIIQQGLMNNQRVSHYIDYAFSKDLFQYIDRYHLPKNVRTFALCDPAITAKNADLHAEHAQTEAGAQVCLLEGCTTILSEKKIRQNARFCCPEHRYKHHNQKREGSDGD